MRWRSPRPSSVRSSSSCSSWGLGNDLVPDGVSTDMTLAEIHEEIELTSERRTELWNSLSHGYDPSVAVELKRLSDRLDHLWDEERTLKAALRFRGRAQIVARAPVQDPPQPAAQVS